MSKYLGFGVMLSRLSGNSESVEAYTSAINKTIARAELTDSALSLWFTDGTGIAFWDDGQSCCESRYFRTDDDLARLVGAVFLKAELRDAPGLPDEYGEHEIQFLDVQTSVGMVQVCAHNEHNGYYGGFSIRVKPLRAMEAPDA